MARRAHAPVSEDERARRIRRWIRRGEARLLARHPALRHQDAVGAILLATSIAGMVFLGWLYAWGTLLAPILVVGNAFLASILHELEHDLIHRLYFRRRPFVHHLAMFLVWAFRGNVVHGWYRRRIHYHHHRASGTESDVEERLLGLGQPWGLRRLFSMCDGTMAFLLNAGRLEREVPGFRRRELALASLPVYPVFAGVLLSFVACHALALPVPGTVEVLALAWVLPNILRQASLQIVSSNVHYYDDVRNVSEETQVLRPSYFWPLQLFCFNFGTTHSFHHYVVEQPFYVRQLISPWVLPALRRYGVRFNDTGTFFRANRYRAA